MTDRLVSGRGMRSGVMDISQVSSGNCRTLSWQPPHSFFPMRHKLGRSVVTWRNATSEILPLRSDSWPLGDSCSAPQPPLPFASANCVAAAAQPPVPFCRSLSRCPLRAAHVAGEVHMRTAATVGRPPRLTHLCPHLHTPAAAWTRPIDERVRLTMGPEA